MRDRAQLASGEEEGATPDWGGQTVEGVVALIKAVTGKELSLNQ